MLVVTIAVVMMTETGCAPGSVQLSVDPGILSQGSQSGASSELSREGKLDPVTKNWGGSESGESETVAEGTDSKGCGSSRTTA